MTTPAAPISETLVRSFFERAPVRFGYLAGEAGYRAWTSLRQAGPRGLESVPPEAITHWFWAVWHFDTSRLRGEVRFDGRENALSVVASPISVELDFELWEWSELAALDAGIRAGDSQSCRTVDQLDAELSHQARTLDALRDRIAAAAPADVAALHAARAERKAAWLKQGMDPRRGPETS